MSDVQQLFLPNARHTKADFGDEPKNLTQHAAYLTLMLMCICLQMTIVILLRVMKNRTLLTQTTHSGQAVCTNVFSTPAIHSYMWCDKIVSRLKLFLHNNNTCLLVSIVPFRDIPVGQINISEAEKMLEWTAYLGHRHNDRIVWFKVRLSFQVIVLYQVL